MRRRRLLPLALGVVLALTPSAALPDDGAGRQVGTNPFSFLDAVRESVPVEHDTWPSFADPPEPTVAPAEPGGVLAFLRRHQYHLLTVFLAEETDYLYDKKVGPPAEPRFFGSPRPFDEAILGRYSGGSGERSFIVGNKSMVLRGVALGAIAVSNGHHWGALADDLMGLFEAQKFNWATSSLVKNIVGRPRPSLQARLDADPNLANPAGAEDTRDGRDSFYSDTASRAFTFMAYADSVLARRLKGHPWARAWSAVGLYGLAGYISYSRIAEGRHYATDVIAGAGAGFAVGKIFHRINHREPESDGRAEFQLTPTAAPGGAGLLLSMRF